MNTLIESGARAPVREPGGLTDSVGVKHTQAVMVSFLLGSEPDAFYPRSQTKQIIRLSVGSSGLLFLRPDIQIHSTTSYD